MARVAEFTSAPLAIGGGKIGQQRACHVTAGVSRIIAASPSRCAADSECRNSQQLSALLRER